MKGAGWEVIDLGTDVSKETFLQAVQQHPQCVLGLSALLTTTMLNMKGVVETIKGINPQTKIFIGGAPVSHDFSVKIGADGFFPDPYGLVNYLEKN